MSARVVIVQNVLLRRAASLLLAFLGALALSGRIAPAQKGPGDVSPILPGDHPDPTIVRIGDRYWTTSTSGDWAPVFVLYQSTDLVHWRAAGAVFPQPPAWASGSFWAPEMVSDQGRVLVYYVARRRNGPLCVGVADSALAQGPYTDHGPIVCQPDGSIDPSFIRDESGQPYLIWKEDGNSIGKPTPIWAQPLSSDLLHFTGEKTQLLVNDPQSWEGGVVEGPYILRHQGRFYLFYAGNACCGAACHYAEGVARATRLLGPWEKDPANPIIRPDEAWKCPGHGTAVETPTGEDYFLYHAYPARGTVYLGRESVLDPIAWSADGWPVIHGGHGPGEQQAAAASPSNFYDDFKTPALDPEWKWPIGDDQARPSFKTGGGQLTIDGSSRGVSFLARSLLGADYEATVGIHRNDKTGGGLGILGDAQNEVVLACHDGHLELLRFSEGTRKALWQTDLKPSDTLWLRVTSRGPAETSFSYSFNQSNWLAAGAPESVAGIPRWDQGLRVALIATGGPGTSVSFSHFSLNGSPSR